MIVGLFRLTHAGVPFAAAPCHDLIEIDGLEAIEHSSRRSHWRTFVVEGDRLDAAIRLAARIPTARLGGAIEIRRVAKYW